MGMYNELNGIKRSVDQQVIEIKKNQEHQKNVEFIKSELKSALQYELMQFENVFDDEIKGISIENVLNNADVLLYNRKFTRQYLNEKYYIVARQVEQIKKKNSALKDDYKKKIALEKWEIQKQRELLKLSQLQHKEAERQNKLKQQKDVEKLKILQAILYILIAPFAIIGLILWGVLSAVAKSK